MAVVDVQLAYEGRQGGFQFEKYTRKYTKTYQVITDDISDDVGTVLPNIGLPLVGQAYTGSDGFTDNGALCKTKNAVQDSEARNVWHVTCEYDSSFNFNPAEQAGEDAEDPTDRAAIIKLSFGKVTVPITKDSAGGPICNKANQPFIDVEAEQTRLILSFSKNYADGVFDFANMQLLSNSTNASTFLGFAAGKLHMQGIETELNWENNVLFWKTDYSMAFNADGWQLKLLNCGDYEKPDSMAHGGELVLVRDCYGTPVHNALLDNDGKRLPAGGTPVFCTFTIYASADWSTI